VATQLTTFLADFSLESVYSIF